METLMKEYAGLSREEKTRIVNFLQRSTLLFIEI